MARSSLRRKPLTNIFENLSIQSLFDEDQPAGSSPDENQLVGMESTILNILRKKGWASWMSESTAVQQSSSPSESTVTATEPSESSRLCFTIKMDSGTRAYIPIDGETPEKLFERALGFIQNIQEKVKDKGDDGLKIMSKMITKQMIDVVFGSNAIEGAGLGLEETTKICNRIFRGEIVDPERYVISRFIIKSYNSYLLISC
jgi:hypothetical protein